MRICLDNIRAFGRLGIKIAEHYCGHVAQLDGPLKDFRKDSGLLLKMGRGPPWVTVHREKMGGMLPGASFDDSMHPTMVLGRGSRLTKFRGKDTPGTFGRNQKPAGRATSRA